MQRLAGRVILFWGWRRALAAFLAGALLVLAQAPYDFPAVGFASFPVLAWLLDGAAPPAMAGFARRLRPSFAIGWWFGFGYFLAGLWWIGDALLVEADAFAWALPFAVLGIPLVMACFYGLAAALARLLWSDGVGRIAALAFAFGIAEWLRGFILTGFPWNAVGYGAMPLPLLMQSASVVGLAGMNALAVFVFASPALLSDTRGRRLGFALAAALCIAHVGFGAWRLTRPDPPSTRTLALRIVQPDIAMSAKWDEAEQDEIFKTLMTSSAAPDAGAATQKPQLILWPETAVPFFLADRPDALASIGALLNDGQMLLAGAVRSEGEGGPAGDVYYNSVVAIDANGVIVDAVDKVHLVPFGEYLPLADLLERVGLTQLVAGPMNFGAGTTRKAISVGHGISAVAFICYEIIFPDIVSTDTAPGGIIVNMTNDAWFGDTPGPYQHFRQAQLRAVENGLPVIRAANSGISGVIDARGRILDALAMNVRGVIDIDLPIAEGGNRLVLPRERIGLGVVLFFGLFSLVATLRRRLGSN